MSMEKSMLLDVLLGGGADATTLLLGVLSVRMTGVCEPSK
jgi:hypothetical protein